MGVIVCQGCGRVIEYFESNQVKTLYAACDCDCQEVHQSGDCE